MWLGKQTKKDEQSLNTSVFTIWLVIVTDGIHRTKETVHGAFSHSRWSHIFTYSLVTAKLKACYTKKIAASWGKFFGKLEVHILLLTEKGMVVPKFQ